MTVPSNAHDNPTSRGSVRCQVCNDDGGYSNGVETYYDELGQPQQKGYPVFHLRCPACGKINLVTLAVQGCVTLIAVVSITAMILFWLYGMRH